MGPLTNFDSVHSIFLCLELSCSFASVFPYPGCSECAGSLHHRTGCLMPTSVSSYRGPVFTGGGRCCHSHGHGRGQQLSETQELVPRLTVNKGWSREGNPGLSESGRHHPCERTQPGSWSPSVHVGSSLLLISQSLCFLVLKLGANMHPSCCCLPAKDLGGR